MRKAEDRVDGLLRGAIGSLAGLAAMGLYFRAAQRFTNGADGEQRDEGNGESREDPIERHEALDDIAIGGMRSREEEAATETVGRIGFETVTHDEPSEEMRQKMGQAVHWGYGILLGAAYGVLRADVDGADLKGGLGYGTAAWIMGDELMVPLLGLAEGPTAHPLSDHAKALGAHLVYGAATSTATHALKRVM